MCPERGDEIMFQLWLFHFIPYHSSSVNIQQQIAMARKRRHEKNLTKPRKRHLDLLLFLLSPVM
jgi:hypothetical protein